MKNMKWACMVLLLALSLGLCAVALGESVNSGDLSSVFQSLAEQSNDPWEKAVYEAGAQDVTQDGSTARFSLRSFNPDLKSMPNYAADPAKWREDFFDRVSRYDLESSLEMNGEAPDSASLKALKSAVSKAAKAAKSAFDQKSVRIALADLILPTPVYGDESATGWGELNHDYHELVSTNAAFEGLDSVQLTPLFYAQSKQSLTVKDGPHALILSCTGADPASLIEGARKSVMDRLSKVYRANEMDEDEIEAAFAEALAKQASSIRKKGGEAHAFVLDLDALQGGDFGADYGAYMQSLDSAPVLEQLIRDVQVLPDAPAQDFPKSGRISGSKSGTKVTIKAPKDEIGRYVQMRNSDTDEMAVDMFIRSGGSATVYVPKGTYYLLIASGRTWYGVEGLFGENGGYSETGETEIMSKRYYHTLTLSAANGDIYVYGSNPSAFRK